MLVGYDEHSKAYWCYEPSIRKVLNSKDVFLYEGAMGLSTLPPKQIDDPDNVTISFSLILEEVL
jgi:hypothetical protein